MTVYPLAPVSGLVPVPIAATATAAQTQPADAVNFETLLAHGVTNTNQKVADAEHAVQMLAVGQADSLPDVMLSLEHARMSLSLMVQVRDRLVEGYQQIMQMQI